MASIMKYFENSEAAIQNPLSYRRKRREKVEKLIEKHIEDSSEITITFKEIYREQLDNDEIMALMSKYFAANANVHNLRWLLLIPEYGDNNNLHFHGLVKAKHKDLSQLQSWLKRRFGRTTIRSIKYTESYKKYLMKEQDEDYIECIYIDYPKYYKKLNI